MSILLGAAGVIAPNGVKDKHSAARGFASLETNDLISGLSTLGGENFLRRDNAKKIFNSIDVDNNGRVSQSELVQWIVKKKIFRALNDGDSLLTANRIFRDIDTDMNGTLDFNEFYKFLQLIAREQRTLHYVNKHHLTCLPASVRDTNSKEFSLRHIENELHEKIQQLTSRDSDCYRQILTLFKTQVQLRRGPENSAGKIKVTGRDFNTFLSMLGLFATREQADALFKKYDANGDGILTVHEFLTKAKTPDYPGLALDEREATAAVALAANRKGKKMFNNTARFGEPVKAQTPSAEIYDMSIDTMQLRIRERMEQTARTGKAFSDQLARRKLFRAFEDKDPLRTKRITTKDFQVQLESRVGVVMTRPHMSALCAKYADDKGLIDYPRLVMEVYPHTAPISTSLYREPRAYNPDKSSRKPAPTWNQPNRNKVNITGSYWDLDSRSASRDGSALPPLSNRGSGDASGLEVRGITPLPRSRGSS